MSAPYPDQKGYPPQQEYPPQQGYPQQQGYAPPPYSQKPPPTAPQMTPMIVRDPQPEPNNYLSLAIFVTICCCLPLGIVGLIKASEVRSRYAARDYNGSLESSRSAKSWSLAGLICGIIMWVLAAVFLVVYLVLIVEQEEEVVELTNDYPAGSSYSQGSRG